LFGLDDKLWISQADVDFAVFVILDCIAGNLSAAGVATVQGFNTQSVTATASTTNSITTCTYTGTGLVVLPACQPNNYNLRVFPVHVEGVRSQSLANWNTTIGRTFNTGERVKFEARADLLNVLNHQRVAAVGAAQMNTTNSQFGLVTS
jgi:hypothetical protein